MFWLAALAHPLVLLFVFVLSFYIFTDDFAFAKKKKTTILDDI